MHLAQERQSTTKPSRKKAKHVKAAGKALEARSDPEDTSMSSDEDVHWLNGFPTSIQGRRIVTPKVVVDLAGTPIQGIADSGAQINVVPRRLAPVSLIQTMKNTNV